MENAVSRIGASGNLARHDGAAILIRHGVLIVCGQEMAAARCSRRRFDRRLPVDLVIDRRSDQLLRHHFQRSRCFGRSETGPPGEVANGRGTMTREVSTRQLRERFVTRSRRRCGQPFIHQHERLLFAGAWADADESLVREPPQQVQAATCFGRDASSIESPVQLGSGQASAAAQRLAQDFPTAGDDAAVDAELPFESRCIARKRARPAKIEHPARVFGGNEVQRAAQRPGANDRALADGFFDGSFGCAARPQSDGPQCTKVVLRLDGAEPANGLCRAGERIMTDALLAQALGGESDGASSGLAALESLRCPCLLYWRGPGNSATALSPAPAVQSAGSKHPRS